MVESYHQLTHPLRLIGEQTKRKSLGNELILEGVR